MSANSPCPGSVRVRSSRSQTVRIRERIAVSTVQEQALAVDTNCPQTVQVSNCPRPLTRHRREFAATLGCLRYISFDAT